MFSFWSCPWICVCVCVCLQAAAESSVVSVQCVKEILPNLQKECVCARRWCVHLWWRLCAARTPPPIPTCVSWRRLSAMLRDASRWCAKARVVSSFCLSCDAYTHIHTHTRHSRGRVILFLWLWQRFSNMHIVKACDKRMDQKLRTNLPLKSANLRAASCSVGFVSLEHEHRVKTHTFEQLNTLLLLVIRLKKMLDYLYQGKKYREENVS